VGTIKETLGDRLKRDTARIEELETQNEELQAQNEELHKGSEASDSSIAKLKDELHEATRELNTLRSRSNLSQQNWLKEKEDMTRQMQHLKTELDSTSAAMGEWEVIAMEERSVRENLSDKVSDLEEQLESTREVYERAAAERDTQAKAIDNLQRALQEIQDARKKELREMVESSEEQLQAMKRQVQEADIKVAEAEEAKQSLQKEVERTAPFEKEVKEKNLLIGKLRHEGIIMNDHLTRALKFIKKNQPDENVDRYGIPFGISLHALTSTLQTSSDQSLPAISRSGPLRPEEISNLTDHRRSTELVRR
jgi:chromosome segregation ATPase